MAKRKIDQEKIKRILIKRGYENGELPKGYEVHHIRPVEERGKDTLKNIRVIKGTKHQQIHINRRKVGKI